MARFADAVLFQPAAAGTGDFTVSTAVQGFMTPALSGMPSGTYTYRAESQDLAQWEIGQGTYTSGTGVLTRTSVFYNSAGTGLNAGQSGAGTKINFTLAPQVGIVQVTADTLGVDQANAWSAAQKSQGRVNIGATTIWISDTAPSSNVNDSDLWWESDTGTLYLRYNDGSSTQWVGISTNANLAAVLYTAQTLSAAQQQQARDNIGVQKKNYIINGAMMVSQENGTTAGTTSGYYPADAWGNSFTNGGTTSFAQVSSVSPAGSLNRLRYTATAADASVAAGDFAMIYQSIEGLIAADLQWGTSAAKAVTVSFGVKAPAGTYCVVATNSTFNRSYVAEYTISSGEANTDVRKTVTIPGDTSGTWLKDTGVGIQIRWGLMAGTTFQQAAGSWSTTNTTGSPNQFNLMGTINNVFELFDVGVYAGAAPEFVVPNVDEELVRCMRYYEGGSEPMRYLGGALTATAGYDEVQFKVVKRATPTMTASNWQYWSGGGAASFSPTLSATTTKFIWQPTGLTNWNGWAGTGTWKANARL